MVHGSTSDAVFSSVAQLIFSLFLFLISIVLHSIQNSSRFSAFYSKYGFITLELFMM